ncbi:hypothetical protein L3X38_003714 [Prunus dulcis]|uniref:Reverse transcriptase Ty1/copia-type domain-containing protein n=1 Tax=Prunus dulcis TaxID=3755 RepID=A0AAD5F2G7_PRUDU|nr:hypothetical protein L3X38_003714 [Prunus dulcis]
MSHRTVFSLSDSKTAKPFDLMHYDVWSPARITSNGFRWFVTFIDDCNRPTWIFLLKKKHDVASILPGFYTMVSTQFHARVKNGVSERKNRQLLEVARSFMLDMFVPYYLWGHAVLSIAYLINRTPSRVLDFKTPHDVFGDHVSPVSVSKLPPKVFGVLPKLMSTFINRVNLILVLCDVSLLVTRLLRKGERGSELENDVFEDTALGKETTCRTEASDRSPISEDETCGPCEETTDRPLELNHTEASDQSPVSGDEAGALGVETTVHLPRGKKAVGCRWVFTLKHKADGSIDRYNTRLVAKGYTQNYGVDYLETFAPVAKLNIVPVLLSLAANRDWPLLQFDVKNAFLHGDLNEEIYMDLPPGIPVTSKQGVVCRNAKNLQKYLASEFEMKSLGDLKYFLDIEVAISKHVFEGRRRIACKLDRILVNREIVTLFSEARVITGTNGLSDHAPGIDTPSEQNPKLGLYPDQVPTDKERYQRLVGKLIYLSHTRPDIAYAVRIVSQFMYSPSEDHMSAVMRILRYLKVTYGKGLMFYKYGHTDVEEYTDVDWVGSVTDRHSMSGYFTFVSGSLVTWRSKKQKVVSRSSAEAEYRGMAQAAIAIVHNHVQHDRTKHVKVDRHFVKEKLDAEIISFPFISFEYQLADVLTKAVSTTVFLNSLDKLGMRDIFAPT